MVNCQKRLPNASTLKLIGGAARDSRLSARGPVIVLLHARCEARSRPPQNGRRPETTKRGSPVAGTLRLCRTLQSGNLQKLLHLVNPDQRRLQLARGIPLVLPGQAEAVVVLDEIDKRGPVGDSGVGSGEHNRAQGVDSA